MKSFAGRVIEWQQTSGRHDLPWQRTRDPYRIWLSEIMLQQTQVSAVVPYYGRFLACFPDLASLAAAPEDDVLALWSGLATTPARAIYTAPHGRSSKDMRVYFQPRSTTSLHCRVSGGRRRAPLRCLLSARGNPFLMGM